jgi:hypothetical protein
MKKLDPVLMAQGVLFEDKDERLRLLVAYRDSKKTRLKFQKLMAPYVSGFRSQSASMFKRSEELENQVIAEHVWLGAAYLSNPEAPTEEEEVWVEGFIIDEAGHTEDVSTVAKRYKVLKDEAWVDVKDTIEGLMRDKNRFAVEAVEVGADVGESLPKDLPGMTNSAISLTTTSD